MLCCAGKVVCFTILVQLKKFMQNIKGQNIYKKGEQWWFLTTGILIHKKDPRAFLEQWAKNSVSPKICKKKLMLQSRPYLLSEPVVYHEPLQNALHCKSSRVLLVIFRGSIQQLASGQCIIFQGFRSRRGQGAVAPARSVNHIQTRALQGGTDY